MKKITDILHPSMTNIKNSKKFYRFKNLMTKKLKTKIDCDFRNDAEPTVFKTLDSITVKKNYLSAKYKKNLINSTPSNIKYVKGSFKPIEETKKKMTDTNEKLNSINEPLVTKPVAIDRITVIPSSKSSKVTYTVKLKTTLSLARTNNKNTNDTHISEIKCFSENPLKAMLRLTSGTYNLTTSEINFKNDLDKIVTCYDEKNLESLKENNKPAYQRLLRDTIVLLEKDIKLVNDFVIENDRTLYLLNLMDYYKNENKISSCIIVNTCTQSTFSDYLQLFHQLLVESLPEPTGSQSHIAHINRLSSKMNSLVKNHTIDMEEAYVLVFQEIYKNTKDKERLNNLLTILISEIRVATQALSLIILRLKSSLKINRILSKDIA